MHIYFFMAHEDCMIPECMKISLIYYEHLRMELGQDWFAYDYVLPKKYYVVRWNNFVVFISTNGMITREGGVNMNSCM